MLRCSDNSIYTGITTDINRRLDEHIKKTKLGAKYTKSHDVVKLEALFQTGTKKDASKLEYRIKNLKKEQKEEIINNDEKFIVYLENQIEISKYKRVNFIQ